MLGGALLVAACGGNGGGNVAVRTVAPGSPAPPVSTGIGDLDHTLTAALAGDFIELAGLTGYQLVACVAQPTGDGSPPICREGEAPGDEVQVLLTYVCEPEWTRPEAVPDFYRELLGSNRELHAVYRAKTGFLTLDAEYVGVIRTGNGEGAALAIKGGRVITAGSNCDTFESLYGEDMVESFIIEPVE